MYAQDFDATWSTKAALSEFRLRVGAVLSVTEYRGWKISEACRFRAPSVVLSDR